MSRDKGFCSSVLIFYKIIEELDPDISEATEDLNKYPKSDFSE